MADEGRTEVIGTRRVRRRLALALLVAAMALGCAAAPPPPPPTQPATVHVEPAAPAAPARPAAEREAPLEEDPPAEQRPIPLSVTIAQDGAIGVDGVPVADLAGVEVAARRRTQAEGDVRAVVHADRQVLYGRVIEVLEALRKGGVQGIAFAVQAQSAP